METAETSKMDNKMDNKMDMSQTEMDMSQIVIIYVKYLLLFCLV